MKGNCLEKLFRKYCLEIIRNVFPLPKHLLNSKKKQQQQNVLTHLGMLLGDYISFLYTFKMAY